MFTTLTDNNMSLATAHPAANAAVVATDVHLTDGISFQLRYLGSTRIFRYESYHFRIDTPFAVRYIRQTPHNQPKPRCRDHIRLTRARSSSSC